MTGRSSRRVEEKILEEVVFEDEEVKQSRTEAADVKPVKKSYNGQTKAKAERNKEAAQSSPTGEEADEEIKEQVQ